MDLTPDCGRDEIAKLVSKGKLPLIRRTKKGAPRVAYLRPLSEAADWLIHHKRDDNGWGAAPGQASSLVNTSEALIVLAASGLNAEDLFDNLKYLELNVGQHLISRGPRTRFVAFPLIALTTSFRNWNPQFVDTLTTLLVNGRNEDDGWGYDLSGGNSDLFSTYLAVEALRALPEYRPIIRAAGRWAASQAGSTGWRLHERQTYSIVGTSFAIEILHYAEIKDVPAYKSGRDLLLKCDNFNNEEVVILGTNWIHCRASAVVRALILTGTEPFHPVVANAVRWFNRRMIDGSGWGEAEIANSPTVRSQFWAVQALQYITGNFDVGVHIPRVSAERMQGLLIEPRYLPFMTGTRWHFIVPAAGFRLFVYSMVLYGTILIAGFRFRPPETEPAVSVGIGVAILAFSAWLVTKRPKQFGRWPRIVGISAAVLGILHLLYGLSIYELANNLKDEFDRIVAHRPPMVR